LTFHDSAEILHTSKETSTPPKKPLQLQKSPQRNLYTSSETSTPLAKPSQLQRNILTS
jgi:hypothetical protein